MKRNQTDSTGLTPDEKRTGSTLGEASGNVVKLVVEPVQVAQATSEVRGSWADGPPVLWSMRSGNSVTSSTRRAIERDLSFGKRKADAPYVSSGPWRDVVMVDVLTANGQNFKGTIKHKEATKDIYQKALGLDRENLHGLEIEFRGHPVISFRLRSQINIDTAFTTDGFSFTRTMGEEEVVIEGKVRGVRDKSSAQPTFQRDVATRVKVKNCKWALMESDINAWLEQYNEITLSLSEETYSDDSDSDEDELGTGSY